MSAAKASSPKILVRIIKCSSSISPQRGEPTPGRYCQDVARAADWYRAYCAAGCFPPRCEQKARKVTLRRPLVGSAGGLQSGDQGGGLFLAPYPVLLGVLVAGLDLLLYLGAQPLVDPKAEDDRDAGDEDRRGIEQQPGILAALAKDQHQALDENSDRDSGNEFGEAPPRLRGKTHLAPADDLLLHEVLGDVEDRHGDHDVSDGFQEAVASLAPGAHERGNNQTCAVDAERQRNQHEHDAREAENAARDKVHNLCHEGSAPVNGTRTGRFPARELRSQRAAVRPACAMSQ